MSDLLRMLLMSPKRPKGKQRRVDNKIVNGHCVATDECEKSFDVPGGGRGRCPAHYQEWLRSKLNLSREKQLEIELRLIRKGELLESHEIRKFRAESA